MSANEAPSVRAKRRAIALLLAGVLCMAASRAEGPVSDIPAFPGAEGFGATTPGGRGGAVVEVTSLADSGPGSLREAMEVLTGPRIVVVKVSGTIELTRPIVVREANSYLTVAGQKAVGGGIQLKDYGIVLRDGAHDVVIRHLRIRPGDTTPEVWDKDAILVLGNEQAPVHHVVVDHVSAQWAIDENIDVHGWAENITFQWCLIAEGSLTGHPKGPHSMGILSGGDPRITVSVHHSLLAHNADRNPRLGGNPNGVNDFRNNVIYNWNNNNASKSSSSARTNFVGNFYIQGPDSSPTSAMGVLIVPDRTNSTGVQLYVDGNWGPPDCFAGCESEWDIGVWYVEDGTKYEADEQLYRIWRPLSAPAVTTHAADVALEIVLENVGATLPRRDAVDQRIVDDVVNGTGAIGIGSDYPGLTSGLWPPDSDHDGMPDAWEATYGLNALDESDSRGDLNGDGYTNIEEFLNDRDPTAPPAAAGAGAVPDGRWVQGEQLVVTKADERRIVLDWAASCRPEDADYAIYEGELPDFASHVPMYCSTGGVSNKTYPPASLNAYVLVVPRRSASEGSYGLDSSGTQRPQAGSACGDQTVLSCP